MVRWPISRPSILIAPFIYLSSNIPSDKARSRANVAHAGAVKKIRKKKKKRKKYGLHVLHRNKLRIHFAMQANE